MKKSQIQQIITLVVIVVIGSGLYWLMQVRFNQVSDTKQAQPIASHKANDYSGSNLKIIKQNYEKFAVQPLAKQDAILYRTKQINVQPQMAMQKKKITDAMETNLDKKIIGEISNLQVTTHPLERSDALNSKIQNLKSLSPQAKAQFGQEIQVIRQGLQPVKQ